MNDTKKAFYQKYLAHLIELNKIHSEQWENKKLVTPCLLSENLCKDLLGLFDRNKGKRDHDAVDKAGKKYEIKATSSSAGTTTYNQKSKVDFLVWMFFDYSEEKIVIKQIEYKKLKNEIKKAKKEDCDTQSKEEESEISINIHDIESMTARKTVMLSKIVSWNTTKCYCMRSLKELTK